MSDSVFSSLHARVVEWGLCRATNARLGSHQDDFLLVKRLSLAEVESVLLSLQVVIRQVNFAVLWCLIGASQFSPRTSFSRKQLGPGKSKDASDSVSSYSRTYPLSFLGRDSTCRLCSRAVPHHRQPRVHQGPVSRVHEPGGR